VARIRATELFLFRDFILLFVRNLVLSLVALISIAPLTSSRADSGCSKLIGDCSYYLCRESEHSCGDDGYFIHFSYRYCREFFDEVKPVVSEATAGWLDRIAVCLQEEVEKMPVETSCSEVQSEAIASHAGCYVSTGFCEIPFADKLRVIKTVYAEALHPSIDEAFAKIVRECGGL
jgi:hypothetical protein